MSKKVYDVVATVGEYTTKDGTTKKRYLTCGAVFQGDKGMSLKLECVPVGKDWSGWLSLYEPRDNQQQPQQHSAHNQAKANGYITGNADTGDIPFAAIHRHAI